MAKFVLTAQLQLQAPNNVPAIVAQLNQQLQGVTVPVNVQTSPQSKKNVNSVNQQLQALNSTGEKLGKTFGVALRRFTAFAVATRVVSAFTNKIKTAVDEAIEFQFQIVRISQVTGKTVQELSSLSDEITRLSVSLGTSSQDLLSATRILAQAGIQARDLEVALEALAKTTLAPTFEDIGKTAEGVVAILAQFEEGTGALETQLGAINKVAGQFAVESGDLISAIRRTGGVFRSAGGDLNDLLALFTSVRATTRESAESIATGLRTIFTRIQRPQTIKFLKQYGVELVDLEGKFVGPFEAVRRLSDAFAGLEQGDITFVKVAEELGGFRQIGKVIPLIQQFNTAERARQAALEGGTSLTDDAVTAQQALAVQITKVKEEFLALIRATSETATFQILVKTSLNLASALIKVADAFKPILPLLTAFAGIKLAKSAGQFFSGIGRGFATRNEGGPIHKFASGGLVPGTGNRDTVPAMLTPGEFVIRKSSVQKIGASKLQDYNQKFATGGRVSTDDDRQKFANGGETISPFFNVLGFKPKLRKRGQSSTGNVGRKKQLIVQQIDYLKEKSKNKTITEEELETLTVLQSRLKYIAKSRTPRHARRLGFLNSGGDVQKFDTGGLAKNPTKSAYVFDFDDTIAATGAKSFKDFSDPETIRSSIATRYARLAKRRSEQGDDIHVLTARIASPGNMQAINEFMQKIGAPAKSVIGVAKMFENDTEPGVKPGTTRKLKIPGKKAKVLSQLSKEYQRVVFLDDSEENILKAREVQGIKAVKVDKEKLFKRPVLRAAGGGMSGGQKVPALLTPGEFVIGKSAASRIGKSNLDSMNKRGVDKFAAGGSVGKMPANTKKQAQVKKQLFDVDSVNTNNVLENQKYKRLSTDQIKAINLPEGWIVTKIQESKDIPSFNGGGKVLSSASKLLSDKTRFNVKTVNSNNVFEAKDYNLTKDEIKNLSLKEGWIVTKIEESKNNAKKLALGGPISKNFNVSKFATGGSVGKASGSQITTQREPKFNVKTVNSNNVLEGKDYVLNNSQIKALDLPEGWVVTKIEEIMEQAQKLGGGGSISKNFTSSKLKSDPTTRLNVSKFATGGEVKQRRIGILDGDLLRDPKNIDVVKSEMEKLGITDVSEYKQYLLEQSVSARKSGSVSRLKTIIAQPGAGKSSLALGGQRAQESDNATLRKTERIPIIKPSDISSVDEVIDTATTLGVNNKNLKNTKESDRVFVLSSSTKEEQEEIRRRRGVRDTTGVNLFGRNPGTTRSAPVDSGPIEARLTSELDPKQLSVLSIGRDTGLRRKTGDQLVGVNDKKIGLFYGSFSPTTIGHESVLDAASAVGIKPEDFVVLVGSNESIKSQDPHSFRTAIFDQDFRSIIAKAGFGSRGATVSKKVDRNFSLPDIVEADRSESGKRNFIIPKSGSKAFIGSDKDQSSINKAKSAGFDPVQLKERVGGISGTQAREAILAGDTAKMQEFLSPEVFKIVQQNLSKIQNRAEVLPKIVGSIKSKETASLADIEEKLKGLPTRINKKLVASDPEYAAQAEQVQELRARRDKIKSIASIKPFSIIRKLSKRYPEKYGISGIQELELGGRVDEKSSNQKKYIAKPTGPLEAAHIGEDLKINKEQLVNYIENYKATKLKAALKEKNVDHTTLRNLTEQEVEEIKNDINFSTKSRIRLNFPRTFNQALRTVDPGIVLKDDLLSFMSNKESSILLKPLGKILNPAEAKENIIGGISTGINFNPADSYRRNLDWRSSDDAQYASKLSVDSDAELAPLKEIILSSVGEKARARLKDNFDILFKPALKDSIHKSSSGKPERKRSQVRSVGRLSKITPDFDSNEPIKLASGGLVPGSGNRDTVPAMLTPGEFVIRKSSVSKIGAENLSAMNVQKFALAGEVKVAKTGKVSKQDIENAEVQDLKDLLNNPNVNSVSRAAIKNQITKLEASGSKGNLKKFNINDNQIGGFFLNPGEQPTKRVLINEKEFILKNPRLRDKRGVEEKAILNGNVEALFPQTSDVKKGLGPYVEKQVINSLSTGITSLANKVKRDKIVDVPPIDGSESALEESIRSNMLSDSGLINTTSGYVFEGLISALTGAKAQGGSASFDFTEPELAANRGKLENLFGPEANQLVKGDAKNTFSSRIISDLNKPKTIGTKIVNDINDNNLSGVTKKFASGGSASGSDTVPALLTPGEFVINKKAATNIGKSNLDRMNKKGVTGFAAGGAVGTVKKIRDKGTPQKDDSGKALAGIFALQSLPSIVSQFTTSVDSSGKEIEKSAFSIGKAFSSFTTTITTLAIASQALNINLLKPQKSLVNFGKKLEAYGRAININTKKAESSRRESLGLPSSDSVGSSKVVLPKADPTIRTPPGSSIKNLPKGDFNTNNLGELSEAANRNIARKKQADALRAERSKTAARNKRADELKAVRSLRQNPLGTRETLGSSRVSLPKKQNFNSRSERKTPLGSSIVNLPKADPIIRTPPGSSRKNLPKGDFNTNDPGELSEAADRTVARNKQADALRAERSTASSRTAARKKQADALRAERSIRNNRANDPEVLARANSRTAARNQRATELKAERSRQREIKQFGSVDTSSRRQRKAERSVKLNKPKGALSFSGVGGFPTFTKGVGNLSKSLGSVTKLFSRFAGPIGLAVGGFAVLNGALKAGLDIQGKLNNAIESGNVERARELAAIQNVSGFSQAFATAGLGFVADFEQGVRELFGGQTKESLVALAGAAALVSKNMEESSKNQKQYDETIRKLEAGAISLQQAFESGNLTKNIRLFENELKTVTRAQRVNANSNQPGVLREVFGELPGVESAESKRSGLQKQSKAEIAKSKASLEKEIEQIRPQMREFARSAIVSGQSLNEFLLSTGRSQEEIDNNGASVEALTEEYNNAIPALRKMADSALAVNFGLTSAKRATAGLTSSLDLISKVSDGSISRFEQSLETLKAVSEGAIVPQEAYNKSIESVITNLSNFGVSLAQTDKIKTTFGAIQSATQGSEESVSKIKAKQATGDLKTDANEFSKQFVDNLNIDPDSKDVLSKILADFKPSDDAVREFIEGNFGPITEELTTKTKVAFDNLLPAGLELEKALQSLTKINVKLIETQNQQVESIKRSISLQEEAAQKISDFGGKTFKAAEKLAFLEKELAVDLPGATLDPNALKAISDKSALNFSNATIQDGQIAQGDSPVEQQKLLDIQNKSRQEQEKVLETARKRIAIYEEEIAIAKKKNELDKQAAESLLSGDIAGFLQAEEAATAASALRSGDKSSLQFLSQEAIGKAFAGLTNEEKQTAAPLTNLSTFQQQTISERTPEIQSLEQEARLMADVINTVASNLEKIAETEVQRAEISVANANVVFQKASTDFKEREKTAGTAETIKETQSSVEKAEAKTAKETDDKNSKDDLRRTIAVEREIKLLESTLVARTKAKGSIINLGNAARVAGGVIAGGFSGGVSVAASIGNELPPERRIGDFNRGGTIYASNGIFIPRGTDTVPAMLTPGEFVVNRAAVQRGNNLQILRSMNGGDTTKNGAPIAAMSTGGSVRYRQQGSTGPEVGDSMFSGFMSSISKLESTFSSFAQSVDKLMGMKLSVKLDPTNVNVNFNGPILSELTGEVKKEVMKAVINEIRINQLGNLEKKV